MTNNNDFLSQEEIDALLNNTSTNQPTNDHPDIEDYITPIEQDALGEIGNIAFGSSATTLSALLGKKVDITTPEVSVIAYENLADEFPEPHVAVYVNYVEGFQGINLLVIKREDAQVIADLMLGGEGKVQSDELNELHISAVQEAMNQMMGSAATSMSEIFGRTVNISPPGIDLMDFKQNEDIPLPEEDVYIRVSFRIKIEGLIDSQIMQLLTVSFSKELVSGLLGGTSSEPEESRELSSNDEMPSRESVQSEAAFPAGFDEQSESKGRKNMENPVQVHPVQFENLSEENTVFADNPNLNLLMDIPLKVTVELGRAKKLVKDILSFTHGSIIELDKLAGEPVDILVNNKMIAKGEVVVIDENFGVRVTDIISPSERMTKIQ